MGVARHPKTIEAKIHLGLEQQKWTLEMGTFAPTKISKVGLNHLEHLKRLRDNMKLTFEPTFVSVVWPRMAK